MTVQELIDLLLGVEDKELPVLFLAGVTGNAFTFRQPCPFECGVMELGTILSSVRENGEIDNLDIAGENLTAFILFPHNENNPHGDSTEDDSGD